MKIFRKVLMGGVSLVLAASLAACGTSTNTATSTTKSTTGATTASSTKATTAATKAAVGSELDQAMAGKYKGKTVSMSGPFTGADEVKFNLSVKDFEKKTGISIKYEGSKEFESTISIRVDGGNAPDIADFPQPGLLASFASKGKVLPMSKIMDVNKLKENYSNAWIQLSTMKGPNGDILAGIWARTNGKGLVWYPKKQFDAAGYKVPKTWDDMITLSNQIVKDGDAPWSIGIGSGTATGWVATDWIEQIMLRTASPQTYDDWVKGKVKFTDPVVKNAVEKMAQIWMNPKYVYGGTKSIVTTSFGDASKPLFDNPPKSWFLNQGNFITSFFPKTAKPGVDYDFFSLPPINSKYGAPVEVGGDIYAAFNDRPEVRAVMQYFTHGESLKTWIQSGGAIGPMNDVNPSWYSNDVDRRLNNLIKNAKVLRFDGSDSMPGKVGAGTFWKAMTDYVSGTTNLDGALKEAQSGWNSK